MLKNHWNFWVILLLTTQWTVNTAYAKTENEVRYVEARKQMVAHQLKGRDIRDPRVLHAFFRVPREKFVLPSWKEAAYQDSPLPIGDGQTISQPYVVALMTEAARIRQGDKILEIGTGSGYQAAVLRELTPHVYSIEIREKLSAFAMENLRTAGYNDVSLKTADGYFGWEAHAPFDAILVTAATNHVPIHLKKQLKIGGKMVLPLGSTTYFQTLIVITRESKERFSSKSLADVQFVPMIGEALKGEAQKREAPKQPSAPENKRKRPE